MAQKGKRKKHNKMVKYIDEWGNSIVTWF